MAKRDVCEVEGCERDGYRRVVGGVLPPRPRLMYGPNVEHDRYEVPEPDGATGAEVVCERHLGWLARAGRTPEGSVRLG